MDLSSISKALDDSAVGHTKKGVLPSPSSHFEDNQMASSSSALKSFLDHISIDSIINFLDFPVMELKHDDCVKDAIRSFYERNLFGAPIIHSVSSDRGDYIDRDIGFIGFSSMALWSLEEIDRACADSKSGNHGFLSMLDQVSQIGQTKV
ncbi:hypothetical protein KSP40_PGU018664 [Platanthera guangdongensis]|uniref:Uncharacterized protein n=1 Tax=Platanthera guangdongensis TaxID=2320717 RepID=A0ABR2LK21_9ASPA